MWVLGKARTHTAGHAVKGVHRVPADGFARARVELRVQRLQSVHGGFAPEVHPVFEHPVMGLLC